MSKSILLTLDSLFDTRKMLLDKFGYEIDKKDYVLRIGDNFKYIGDTFKSIYSRRHKGLLNFNYLTPIMVIVKSIMIDLEKDILVEGNTNNTIVLNVYTDIYTLNNREIELLKRLIKTYFMDSTIINIENKKIELEDYKKHNFIIDYDGMERVNNFYMSGMINIGDLLDNSLIIPDNINDKKVLHNKDKDQIIEDISILLSMLIHTIMIDKKMFSIEIDDETT